MSFESLINELSEICGIVPEYWDIFGQKHEASIETKKAVLRAMGMKIDSEDEVGDEIKKIRERQWKAFLEPVKVISANEQPAKMAICLPVKEGDESGLLISCAIENESGELEELSLSGDSLVISEERMIDGERYIKIFLTGISERPIGYYSVTVACKCGSFELSGKSRLIIAPDACYMPPALKDKKTWGLCINLYSIRSRRNWGIGDFTDLKNIVKWIHGLGGGFAGINPLHAIPNKKPCGISPYSPISRLYKNFIYLDIEAIPEVAESEKAQAVLNGFESWIAGQRKEELICYEKIAYFKERILRYAFEVFLEKHYKQNSQRAAGFKKYIAEEGGSLDLFATYMALSEMSDSLAVVPDSYSDPSCGPAQELRLTHEKEVLFYKYAQWLIDGQLKEVSEEAERLGMAIGLYHDLAIGSVGGGSDVWTMKDIFASNMDVGAPPDDFNPDGQNWGFPPLIPEKLRESGYEFFIRTIRKNMKLFGALRIDHALGIFRLFWIPQGMHASHGAYVKQPAEDFLKIIALESVRNKTLVIAEDLGTVGDNVREALHKFEMLSYRLLYFERNYPEPSFLSPEKYPETAMCAVTTHDLPTIYGWWEGRDIELKKRLGIFADERSFQRHIYEREKDKALLLDALNLEHTARKMTPELCVAIYGFLSRTPCRFVGVSLDDMLGTLDQQNMPGITDSYSSWMQKTPEYLEDIVSNKSFLSLSEAFRKNNR
jgi:4-alpha-glucanotransferase